MNESKSLQSLATALTADLKHRQPRRVEGVTKELHALPPFLPKERWSTLGNALRIAEQPTESFVAGDKWISLRCDGTGFSKFLPRLRKLGIIEEKGFSEIFAGIMQQCCQRLMGKFAGVYGYTHSDEMTILIAPANVTNGVQQCHPYNGRVQKLCSLAASTVTGCFNYCLVQQCKSDPLPIEAVATFDCRVGVYETREQAISLLLWRAYDCGINGVSDAVYHRKHFEGRKDAMKLSTDRKLEWLLKHDSLLPLPRHQREGTYYARRKRVLVTTNQETGNPVKCLRSRIESVPGNLIWLYRDGTMFPPDESLDDET